MFKFILNWRAALYLLALAIVAGTVFYSRYLADKIVKEEQQKVEQWVAASKFVLNNPGADLTLPNLIKNEQTSIPIIETNEKDSIITFINLDSTRAKNDPDYLKKKLKEFSNRPPIVITFSDTPLVQNKYYYGNTRLLKEVQYFPLIQLAIVAIIIFFIILFINARSTATQNQVWAGMAKETAHQLGTPITSLQGWMEILKEDPKNIAITTELQKDVDRLKLVSDRFGKIGSKPQLEEVNIITEISQMVEYIKKRAPEKVRFHFNTHGAVAVNAKISVSIFDWVIENLLKNSLDAMEGKGEITIDIKETNAEVVIDVADTGKGIPKANFERIFKPGFTTKKRGWGLGLSLSRRIIEQYHEGKIFVEDSVPGKRTVFRIVLKK